MILKLLENAIIRMVEPVLNNRNSRESQVQDSGLLLGTADHPYGHKGQEMVFIPEKDRLKHLYLLGASGFGKSKLLESMIRQDILAGKGFALIDAHGDLCRNILNYLSTLAAGDNGLSVLETLSQKLILIEPFNRDGSIGFNPLEIKMESSFFLATELMGIFKKIWRDAHWGPRMEELLRNTLITLSENRLTLLEAVPLLTNPAFRDLLIETLTPGAVRDYWFTRYNVLSDRMQAVYREPVLNRISIFTSDPGIRLIVGQRTSTFDFRRVMDEGKWLIINLSKGHLRENIHLLGALLITRLMMAAMSRVDLPERNRRPFYLFVDEFQNFIGEDFKTILSEARKYGLGLVLAHQNLDQIDRDLRSSIFGNVANQIFFRLSHQDASLVSSEIDQRDKVLLERKINDFKVRVACFKRKGDGPRILQTLYLPEIRENGNLVELIKDISFSNFTRTREEIEEDIQRRQEAFRTRIRSQGGEMRRPGPGRYREELDEGWNDW